MRKSYPLRNQARAALPLGWWQIGSAMLMLVMMPNCRLINTQRVKSFCGTASAIQMQQEQAKALTIGT